MVADDAGNIYVLDSGNCRVQKFDKHGNYLLTIGTRGQGPGELGQSTDVQLDRDGNIIIFDQGNNRITRFDSRGNLLNSITTRFRPEKGVVDSDNNIYIYSQHSGKLVHKFSSQGNYLLSFIDEVKSEKKRIESHLNGLGHIGIDEDDRIFLVLTFPYTIFICNKEGKILEKIITETSYAQPPYVTPDNAVITNFFVSGLAISQKGYILCRLIAFKMPDRIDVPAIRNLGVNLFKEHSYVDIFDPKGHFLIHQRTPNFTWGGFFDKSGYYYGIEEAEDYFRAVKYSVQF